MRTLKPHLVLPLACLAACGPAAEGPPPSPRAPALVPSGFAAFAVEPFLPGDLGAADAHLTVAGLRLAQTGDDCLELTADVGGSVNGVPLLVFSAGGYGRLPPNAACKDAELRVELTAAQLEALAQALTVDFEIHDASGSRHVAWHFPQVNVAVVDQEPDAPMRSDRDHLFTWSGGSAQTVVAASYSRYPETWECMWRSCYGVVSTAVVDTATHEVRLRASGLPGTGEALLTATTPVANLEGTFTRTQVRRFSFDTPLQ